MSASKAFELAINYIYTNRIKYNEFSIEYQKKRGGFPNYEFTNAYATVYNNLKNYLINNIDEIIRNNNISFHNAIISSLCQSMHGNLNDDYKSEFVKTLTNSLDTYPLIIKQTIIDYCEIFINDKYKLQKDAKHEFQLAYFNKMIIPVIHKFNTDLESSFNDINELNKITRDVGIEYINGTNLHIYCTIFNEKVIKTNNPIFLKVIIFLEKYIKNIKLLEQMANVTIKESNTESSVISKRPAIPKAIISKNKINNSYNDKKPLYMKDDLLKLAINKNIIGASRFTIPLLEESLLQSLEGKTLREKSVKLKLDIVETVNDRGITIAILELITNKITL
jgi:hypothetical protein